MDLPDVVEVLGLLLLLAVLFAVQAHVVLVDLSVARLEGAHRALQVGRLDRGGHLWRVAATVTRGRRRGSRTAPRVGD